MWIRNRHHHSDGDFAGPDGYGRHYRHGSGEASGVYHSVQGLQAQQDCAYLEQLYKERQQEYYVAQQNYANYMDANKGVVLQSALTERERLQNDMNLAYQVYSQVATQLQVARAKVQEAKPVFAVVEPASVPLLPSGTSKKVILVGFISWQWRALPHGSCSDVNSLKSEGRT